MFAVTSSMSWHGHPKPCTRWRASLAAYFFTVTVIFIFVGWIVQMNL